MPALIPHSAGIRRSVFDFFALLYIEKRWDVAALMLAALLPIHKTFTNLVMLVIVGIAVMVTFRRSDREIPRKAFHYFLISVGFYLMMVVSLAYSADFSTGLNFVVANGYLFVYPLLLLVFARDVTGRYVNAILFAFCLACVSVVLYMHVEFFRAGLYTQFQQAEYRTLPFRDVTLAIGHHPTYATMWFMFACMFLIQYLVVMRVRGLLLWFIVLAVGIFIVTSVLLSVKVTTIAFLLAGLLTAYKLMRNKVAFLITGAAIIVVFAVAVVNVSFLRTRFIDEFRDTKFEPPVGLATNSLNIRVGIYHCAWSVFGDHWLVGTGIGDAQHFLNNCYDQFDTNVYRQDTYNTHNNYLAVAASTGVIGLGLFLVMLIFHWYKADRYNNLVFLIFLVIVMTTLTAENAIARNQGVVFYSLFCSLLARLNLQRDQHRYVNQNSSREAAALAGQKR